MISTMSSYAVETASNALLNYLEDEGIEIHDAARVLTTCLVAVIHENAVTYGLKAKDGGRIITNIIMEALPNEQ